MTRYWSNFFIIAVIIGALLISAGCISQSPHANQTQQNITLVPTPVPTPNPYGLDSEGYYIAYINGYPWDSNFSFVDFNVTLKEPKITSGESLVFDGTTNLTPGTLVAARIFEDMYGLQQMFLTPVLPGVNGTHIIKMKIPAMDIHIDRYFDNDYGKRLETEFFKNGTYTTHIRFGPVGGEFAVTSDPNHPMIIEYNECQSAHHGVGYCNTTNTWTWTNDTATQHVWDANDPRYENGTIKPYPTYPRPNRTCLKQRADGSGDILVVC